MSLRVTILGCGSSMGVPRLGGPDGMGDWGRCNPNEPKNRRSRSSILVERVDGTGPDAPRTTMLIDTSPDLRTQLLHACVSRVDAVLITHDHADQTHGIDDLRILAYKNKKRIPVYLGRDTSPNLVSRFNYCFDETESAGYPAILNETPMPTPGKTFTIDGPGGVISVVCVLLQHGSVPSYGFLFSINHQTIAYSPDVNGISHESFSALMGCDTWILDALRYEQHASHSHLRQSIEWIEQVGARRGVLTNMHIDMDYNTVMEKTPAHIEPGYDGMIIVPGENGASELP